jgi:glyoxylase-like metal-dependent hydrolase (beta-lactamase superfamily II)
VIFKQYRFEPLAQASYVLGCARAREAIVVDPSADLGEETYVLDAADLGLSIVGVFETHVHADYVSCGRELSGMAGVPLRIHEAARGLVRYDFEPFADGAVFDIGTVRVTAVHTPGHTPESTSYLVADRARAEEPWFVLTGDTLFVGDVGRPDLLVGDPSLDVMDEAARARALWESITTRLFTLPDAVEVYPAHYGGSTCGGVNMSGKVSSTIGFERRFNLAMRQPDAAAFARFVKETARPNPDNYARIKSYNLGLIAREALRGATA